ncbi:MAG: hypothetical protein V3R76_05810 [Gammaproteobacteria bacterium]
MIDESDIPVLTDLIEQGAEIELSDLGLDQVFASNDEISEPRSGPAAKITMTPALEQEIRRILDEHLELAWQEIRLAIQRSATGTESES